jgi:hypothetical protein
MSSSTGTALSVPRGQVSTRGSLPLPHDFGNGNLLSPELGMSAGSGFTVSVDECSRHDCPDSVSPLSE